MASLSGRWKALTPGKRARKRTFAGWSRVDADNVIRGWAMAEADPSARAEIEIRIDGEPVARALADRSAPELAAAGKGDGLYGFAVVVPERFRDGADHAVEAVAAATGDLLFSKSGTFRASPRARAPALRVEAMGPGRVRGVLTGGQFAADTALELWAEGRRRDGGVTVWRWRGPEREFTFEMPLEAFCALPRDAALAAPGMAEAGCPLARLFEAPLIRARPSAGRIDARLTPLAAFEAGIRLEARLLQGDAPIAEAAFHGRTAALDLPPGAAAAGAAVELVIDGRPLAASRVAVDTRLERLSVNGGFEIWSGDTPAGWSVGPDVSIHRSFHAFADGEGQGATGHVASLRPGGAAPAVLLRGKLVPPPSGERTGDAALLWRASAAAELELRFVDAAGVVVESARTAARAPWAWTHLAAPLDCARLLAHDPLFVEIVVTAPADADLQVEIAGVRVGGGDGFGEPKTSPRNLVVNAGLTDWPRGMIMEAGPAREETAAGWFVQNRKSPSPVRIYGAPVEGGAACSLTVAAEDVADFCRLEAEVDAEVLQAGTLELSFAAASPSGPGGAHTVIDRIFLLARGGQEEGGRGEAVVGTAARRLLVGRELAPFRTVFKLDPEAVQALSGGSPKVFLAFDLRRAAALTLQAVRLAAADETVEADGPALALEDPAIAAQAGIVKGLEHWISPMPVEPGAGYAATSDAAGMTRWSWTGAAAGGVEVVVCVHDAAEEALACLRSLEAASGMPFTVRVIDDGSGEDTRRRLLAFVADKPWMRLISTGENIGYTAAANLGVKGSDAQWVVLLNSDTVVSPGWLEGLMEAAASAPDIAFVGPVSNAASYQSIPELKSRAGTWKANDLPPGWTPARMAAWVRENADQAFPRATLLNGFCTLIRRDAFMALGGFDEAAFPAGYGEENDLCVRAAQAGYGLAVADHVYVHHKKSASFGSKRRTELQKAAGQALARLHPGVDFGELGDRMREIPALVNLRAAARRLYKDEA